MRPSVLVAMLVISAGATAQTKHKAVSKAEPRKVELIEGKAVDLGHGVSVTLRSVMYTHATDKTGRSVNDSFMQLEVTRDGKMQNVTITRLFPDAPVFTHVGDLELAIDYVDAYHQPSTGGLLIR